MDPRTLLSEIEAYLAASGCTPSGFGRSAMKDPGFVFRLRNGGECRSRTVARVRAWMAANPPESAASVEAAE